REARRLVVPAGEQVEEEDDRHDHRADLDDEDHRVAQERSWVELQERVADRRADDRACEQALASVAHCDTSRSRARLSSSTSTPGSPRKPSDRPSVYLSTSSSTRCLESPRTEATRAACERAFAGEMSGASA